MWWINWVKDQEWEDWVVVRKMTDLPDEWLEIIDTWTKFYKNELLEILTVDPTYKNQEMFIIDDSTKMEELYSNYFALWDYQEALNICISMIQREVKREVSKWAQSWYNLKAWAYEVNFDNVSTPIALKWKQRIEEIEDIAYSKLIESWKTKQALQICISMIQEEVKKEILRCSQIGINLKTWAYEVNFDNISTPTALKWKQRISELTR